MTIDGRPRTLASAEFVAVPRKPPAQNASAAEYSTNAGCRRRPPDRHCRRRRQHRRRAGQVGADRGRQSVSRPVESRPIALRSSRCLAAGHRWISPPTIGSSRVLSREIAGQAGQNELTRRIGLGEALAIERGDDTVIAQVVEQHCTGDSTPQGRDSCLQQLTQEANLLLSDTRERSRSSIAALKSLFDRLGTSETPKTIVLISEGLLLDPTSGTWPG